MKVKCDCSHEFDTTAKTVTTCPTCKKRIRVETHQLRRTTPKLHHTTHKLQPKIEWVSLPFEWVEFLVLGLKTYLSAYKKNSSTITTSNTSIVHHKMNEILSLLMPLNLKGIKVLEDKVGNLNFKLKMLNPGGNDVD